MEIRNIIRSGLYASRQLRQICGYRVPTQHPVAGAEKRQKKARPKPGFQTFRRHVGQKNSVDREFLQCNRQRVRCTKTIRTARTRVICRVAGHRHIVRRASRQRTTRSIINWHAESSRRTCSSFDNVTRISRAGSSQKNTCVPATRNSDVDAGSDLSIRSELINCIWTRARQCTEYANKVWISSGIARVGSLGKNFLRGRAARTTRTSEGDPRRRDGYRS